jgi:DNA invertase Pin-like site-specific DNA recombinase
MTIIGYARVSTTDQDLSIQEAALRAAGCDVIRAEKQSGTSTAGRAELRTVLDFIGKGDVLMVTRVDRLARSIGDLQDIVRALKVKGASLRATEQPIDTSTAAGKCFLDMLGVFAEFETNLRRERQLEGIAKAKAAGVYTGRKPRASVRLKSPSGSGSAAHRSTACLKSARRVDRRSHVGLWRKNSHNPSLSCFERAIRPAAGLLLDDHRIDCAFELHDACGYRARRAFGSDGRDSESAEDFVGIASRQDALLTRENKVAAARRDVDIAHFAGDGIRRDSYLIDPRNDHAFTVEQAYQRTPIKRTEQRPVRSDNGR